MTVYFYAAGDDLIKIGYSANVRTRLMAQRRTCPGFELLGVVEGDLQAEKSYHARFAAANVRGEWFRDTPEIRAEIKTIVGPDMPKMPNTKAGGRRIFDWSQTPYAIAEREKNATEDKKFHEFMDPLTTLLDWAKEQQTSISTLASFHKIELRDQRDLLQYKYYYVLMTSTAKGLDPSEEELSDLALRRDRFRLLVENIVTCNA